ncbi:MAG: patatin [Oscillatoria sp. SIO1A7]|nr:patatin [Oscillatoria sp. SIO1A7]
MAKFRILSLDGGGIRGVLSARLLKEVETIVQETTGQKLHEYFDLVAGTSTGSILAAGIACQKSADEIIDLYKDEGENIFLKGIRGQRGWRWLGRLIGANALYPHDDGRGRGLANVLKGILTNPDTDKPATIADREIKKQIQLLILAYDVQSRNTTWFANDEDPVEWEYEKKTELWKICTASASAPTFFPPYQIYKPYKKKEVPYIDGGVADNNPALAAVSHAFSMTTTGDRNRPSNLEEIAVLSIGTGQTNHPYTYNEIKGWGLAKWATKIPDIFLDPDAQNTEYTCRRIFLGVADKNYLRLDFDLNTDKEGNRYNEYVFKKKNVRKEISEEIDDPNVCEDLIEAADCYLDEGTVRYGYKDADSGDKAQAKIKVKDAIKEFIKLHKD